MYDCAIIGGGIAGLQAAIQLGRYMHRVVVIDAKGGRSTLARRYGNILGFPNGVSGRELREAGRAQAREIGVEFIEGRVSSAHRRGKKFELVIGNNEKTVSAKRLLISTGLTDRIPEDIEGLKEALGLAVYVCPDCDGYEIRGLRTAVLGAGNTGAAMACVLRYWTDDVTYINHEPEKSPVSERWKEKCTEAGVRMVNGPILEVRSKTEDKLSGVRLADDRMIEVEKGFIAFGHKAESDIATMLGVERLENGHIPVDGRTKVTNIKHVWAAGDVAAHSQMLSVAIGDGAQAAIWIHKSLQE
ncbi:NAD(P)/FAD-dependent oxidoreductase [Aneurinibacillus thermoaerophilus]|uniref:NAD(P)/FAD-dependent oxidoreductase n=1 Tax=Aneurinibacillus thermoaerophilus TaxID=143495 RepID=A0ABX8YET4_ANETH|nr:NAD(P)/FAD-dependent oxidoreductase [Aneurinibacillus thermoaerophilus]MED0679593.1 NAD(P)/FAD-dependent oxidoreductase [Aneurinibacillus thermoaerophilus]MED0764980.1 NAD(P)/FAD-dependent oxidoreductase [Aneurinibacillus thermoaerophilus]QYY43819.1 NAD(P)/FAD-dependent oxidoreductase [Aneurinibacillus thermoaerophilus]